MGAAAAPCHRLHHRQRPARGAGGRRPARGVRPWVHPVMSPNRVGERAHEIHDAEAELRGVRGAAASDGFRQEPARGYGVHLRVREMWIHDAFSPLMMLTKPLRTGAPIVSQERQRWAPSTIHTIGFAL